MEYIGIVVGIILLVLGIKMMENGSLKTDNKSDDSQGYQAMYQQPSHSRLNYNQKSEPNNWMYFFGKVITLIAGFLILLMILFLVGLF